MMKLKDSYIIFFQKLSQVAVLLIFSIFNFTGLVGCAGSYISKDPIEDLTDKSGSIIIGQMNYNAVHSTLGDPFFASRYWRIDVFRDSSSQVEIPFAITPWPVPFARLKDDIYRYTLVAYNEDQLAEDTGTGILRRPSKFRIVSPIKNTNMTLQVEAGDFTFVNEQNDRYDTLLVKPARWHEYLKLIRFSKHCAAVIGCGCERGCSDELSVDGGVSLPVPLGTLLKLNLNINPVAAINLLPGTHTFNISASHLKGEQTVSFSCQEGEVLYFVIDIFAKEYSKWFGASDIEWKIDQSKDMPSIFTDRDLILYRGEQWIVDPEPDYQISN
jgi:hypothetical protein